MSFTLLQTTECDEHGTYQLSHPVSLMFRGLKNSTVPYDSAVKNINEDKGFKILDCISVDSCFQDRRIDLLWKVWLHQIYWGGALVFCSVFNKFRNIMFGERT